MAKKNFSSETEKKQSLGKLIAQTRGNVSQRQLAKMIDLPPSNLTYIENGVNAPSPEVYLKIMQTLNPKSKIRNKMDKLYMEIRKLPPPDVCNVLMENTEIVDKLRILSGLPLSQEQLQKVEELFNSFKEE